LKKIVIAIDGLSGCGKSTTAKRVAAHLGYLYIDTGAMYRAVSLYFLQHGIQFDQDSPEVQTALQNICIDLKPHAEHFSWETYLNGEEIEEKLRTPEVSQVVSKVSALPSVRKAMVAQQQRMGKEKGVVMDGRDIGTVVFPHAELKVFMTASLEVRAMRRQQELAQKGIQVSLGEIRENLAERDRLDSSRKIAPLKQAHDAIVIDTTELTIETQVQRVCDLAREILDS